MIKLVSDSSGDMTQLEGANYESVPLTISTDEASFRDDAQLDIPQMLDYLSQYSGRSYTACPSVDDWMNAFGDADTVYVGTITSGLSGAYNSAQAARELYLQSHPDARIHVFDSLSTGPELRLLMEKISELVSAGLDFSAVCEKATAYLKTTRLFFSLQSVHNLAQNGRVSKVVAAAVGMLGIRIVGTASPEGTLQPGPKCRGDRKALPALIDELKKAGYAGGKMRIGHVQNPKLCSDFIDLVRQHWPKADIMSYLSTGLCSYYAERGAILVGVETE